LSKADHFYPEAVMDSRDKNPQAGIGFIELLVTIVLAGLVFAAIVPMFVLAQKKNSADNMRNIALQVAQDKTEKIRQLDYDAITLANLQSSSFASGQFGPAFIARSGGGSTRTLHIAYTVSLMPSGSSAGSEKYKKVVVDVYWDAPPSPVKHAVLQTYVYKQYAGPGITSFTVSTLTQIDESHTYIMNASVQLRVVISDADIGAMNAGGNPSGWVRFVVNSYNGTQVLYQDVATPQVGQPAVYTLAWDATASPDGIYSFKATAYSMNGFAGNTMTVAYRLELGPPDPPTNLVASPGDTLVTLTWTPPPDADLAYYQLWRGLASGAEAMAVGNLTAATYVDTGLTNDTRYFYFVKAVDDLGNVSSPSDEVSVKPKIPHDDVPPTVPGAFSVAKVPSAPTVRLSWTASTDSGDPASGLAGYSLERSANGTSNWAVIYAAGPADLQYNDSGAGYSTRWYYRVRAYDNAGNYSAYTAVLSALTDAIPTYSLTVNNTNSSAGLYVVVQNAGTGMWYDQGGNAYTSRPGDVTIKKNKSAVWSSLPAGTYMVYGSRASTTTQSVDLNGGNNSVDFP
jgi:hypothetical protein